MSNYNWMASWFMTVRCCIAYCATFVGSCLDFVNVQHIFAKINEFLAMPNSSVTNLRILWPLSNRIHFFFKLFINTYHHMDSVELLVFQHSPIETTLFLWHFCAKCDIAFFLSLYFFLFMCWIIRDCSYLICFSGRGKTNSIQPSFDMCQHLHVKY